MCPSADPDARHHRRVVAISASALAAFVVCGVSPALALPPGATTTVVSMRTQSVTFTGGTAELDGSTTFEDTRTGSKSRIDCTLLFAKDSDRLLPGAKAKLRRLAGQFLRQGAGQLQVTGYTDDLGSAAHGLDLSRRRAQRVATELAHTLPDKNFPMTVRGRGEAQPAVPNTSEANRRKNRRVTVILTRTAQQHRPEPASRQRPSAKPTATAEPRPVPTATATPSAAATQKAAPSHTVAPTPTANSTPTAAATPGATGTPTLATPSTEQTAIPVPLPAQSNTPSTNWPAVGGIAIGLILLGAITDRIRRRRPRPHPSATPTTTGEPPTGDQPTQASASAPTAHIDHGGSNPASSLPTPFASPQPPPNQPPAAQPKRDLNKSLGETTVATIIKSTTSPDAQTDQDLADWFAPDTHRPRLTLLGPVHVRTRGKALARRKPYYTELLAYLTLKPSGATADEIADAFNLTTARVRTDMKILRDWLGVDPRTAQPYLPNARTSPAALQHGIPTYQVIGVLCDWLLFTQLQRRANTATADDARADLDAALQLVTGRPFSQTRVNGWGWNFEGQRIDLHATTAVVNVATTVAEHHRSTGNHEASERALAVATSTEVN